jgi:uncharacterized membrane protein
MNDIKLFVTSFASFIVLDAIWFMAIADKFSREKIAPIARLKPDGSLDVNYLAGLVVYLMLAALFTFFLFPKIKTASGLEVFLWSALFGLCVYGVYDLTNMAFLKHWPLSLTVVDILWGAAAFGLTGIIVKLIIKN